MHCTKVNCLILIACFSITHQNCQYNKVRESNKNFHYNKQASLLYVLKCNHQKTSKTISSLFSLSGHKIFSFQSRHQNFILMYAIVYTENNLYNKGYLILSSYLILCLQYLILYQKKYPRTKFKTLFLILKIASNLGSYSEWTIFVTSDLMGYYLFCQIWRPTNKPDDSGGCLHLKTGNNKIEKKKGTSGQKHNPQKNPQK